MGYMEWWMILLSHPVHSWDKSSHWLVLSTMWGEWRKPTKREARGCLKIEDRRMRIKKGETKYRGMKDSGMEVREREVTSISTSTSTRHNKPLHLNQGAMAHFPSLGVAASHTLHWINPTAATSAIDTFLQARHVPRCDVQSRACEKSCSTCQAYLSLKSRL